MAAVPSRGDGGLTSLPCKSCNCSSRCFARGRLLIYPHYKFTAESDIHIVQYYKPNMVGCCHADNQGSTTIFLCPLGALRTRGKANPRCRNHTVYRQAKSPRCPVMVGQSRLGLVQIQYPILRLPRQRPRNHLVLPLGTDHQASHIWLSQQRL